MNFASQLGMGWDGTRLQLSDVVDIGSAGCILFIQFKAVRSRIITRISN